MLASEPLLLSMLVVLRGDPEYPPVDMGDYL